MQGQVRHRHSTTLSNVTGCESSEPLSVSTPRGLTPPAGLKPRVHFSRLLHWGPMVTLCLVFGLSIGAMLLVSSWSPITGWFSLDVTLLCCFLLVVLFYLLCAVSRDAGSSFYALTDLNSPEINAALPTCSQCRNPKPARSHHCRKCGSCILKMDHHCPWINNCVGFQNEQAFILFVSSACSTTLITFFWYVIVFCCEKTAMQNFICLFYHFKSFLVLKRFAWRMFADIRVQPPRVIIHILSLFARRLRYPDVLVGEFLLLVLCSLLCILVAIGTGCLLWGCLSSIFKNLTWLEELALEDHEHRSFRRNYTGSKPFTYDEGWRQNLRQFVGPSLLKFLFPLFKRPECDFGVYYHLTPTPVPTETLSVEPHLDLTPSSSSSSEDASDQVVFSTLEDSN